MFDLLVIIIYEQFSLYLTTLGLYLKKKNK